MECHVVTGEFDYFMLIRTRDSDSFNRLHAEQLLYLPGCDRCARSWCCATCSPPPSCRWRCSDLGRTYRAAQPAHHGRPQWAAEHVHHQPAIKSPAPEMHGQQLLAERHPAGGQTHHGHQQGEGRYAVLG